MGILDEIINKKKMRLDKIKSAVPLRELKSMSLNSECTRDFMAAVKRTHGIKLIAEIKKASPSKGVIRPDFDPELIARIYEEKADAVSVLTEEDFFQGNIEYLGIVKSAQKNPVLRKDFIFDEYQIYEARAKGADAVLLIGAILDKTQAKDFLALSKELGLATLYEVHNFKELETALSIDADIIGINNRNLDTLRIDLNTTFMLKVEIHDAKIVVSESGISGREEVLRLEDAGIDAMLIGTSFMQSADIGGKIDELMGRQ